MKAIVGVLAAVLGLRAQVSLRVVDCESGVERKTLAAAERVVEGVFAKAGVRVAWRRCPEEPGCQETPGTNEFRVLIVKARPKRLRGDRIGFALIVPGAERESYAGILYPLVEDAARTMDAPLEVVLGAAMAHEAGHLLLGSQAHWPGGIMSRRFREEHLRMAARGELRFTPKEAERIRRRLGVR